LTENGNNRPTSEHAYTSWLQIMVTDVCIYTDVMALTFHPAKHRSGNFVPL
jgi:hypothetical protein